MKIVWPEVQGYVRVQTQLLPGPATNYCFFMLSDKREEFGAGDYALVDTVVEMKDGDRVIIKLDDFTFQMMRAVKTEDGWTFAPLTRSPMRPVFVVDPADYVIGVVVKVFDVGGRRRESKPGKEG